MDSSTGLSSGKLPSDYEPSFRGGVNEFLQDKNRRVSARRFFAMASEVHDDKETVHKSIHFVEDPSHQKEKFTSILELGPVKKEQVKNDDNYSKSRTTNEGVLVGFSGRLYTLVRHKNTRQVVVEDPKLLSLLTSKRQALIEEFHAQSGRKAVFEEFESTLGLYNSSIPCSQLKNHTNVGLRFLKEPLENGMRRALTVSAWEAATSSATVLIYVSMLSVVYLGCRAERNYNGPQKEIVDMLTNIGEIGGKVPVGIVSVTFTLWQFHITRCWKKAPIAMTALYLLMPFSLAFLRAVTVLSPSEAWLCRYLIVPILVLRILFVVCLDTLSGATYIAIIVIVRPVLCGYIGSRTVDKKHQYNVMLLTTASVVGAVPALFSN